MDIDDVLKKLGFTPLSSYRPRLYERKTPLTNLLVDLGKGDGAIAIHHGSYRVNREYVHFKCDNAAMLEFMSPMCVFSK